MSSPPATAPRTQRERSDATRGELLAAARHLFATRGYEATSLRDAVEAAGVTKGALYHHFSGKRELFRAVFEQEQQRLAEVSGAAYRRKRDPWQGFQAGCRAFLEASLDRGVQRITLLDAPAVLGWEELREIEAKYSLAQLIQGLEILMESGDIDRRPAAPLAHMLNGAICDAAMMVARSANQRAAMRQVTRELAMLLEAMRATELR